MKAFVIDAPGKTSLVDVREPAVGDGDVLLRVRTVGYCGTDLSTFRGVNPLVSYPRIPGHELGVEVELDDGTRATAWCWVMAPGREGALTREPWDAERFAERELAGYLRQVRELGTPYRSR